MMIMNYKDVYCKDFTDFTYKVADVNQLNDDDMVIEIMRMMNTILLLLMRTICQ